METGQGGGDSILDDDDDVGQSRDDQLSLINRYRARHGLPPVKPRDQEPEPCPAKP